MSKVAHLVRNGLFNGGISYDSSEKDAKYATKKNLGNKRNYKITDPHFRLFTLFAQT